MYKKPTPLALKEGQLYTMTYMFIGLLESICKPAHFLFINNFILKYISAKNVTLIIEENYIQ